MEKITSKSNDSIKRLHKLMTSKRERDLTGLFVCEGLRLCMDGVKSGMCPEESYITEQAAKRYPEAACIAEKSVRARIIADEVADKIADTGSSQGVFAVFKKLDNVKTAVKINSEMLRGAAPEKGRYVILSSIQDPGNMGAIIRACEAFGIDGLFISPDCPDIYAPKSLRASMGGIFRLPLSVCSDIEECISVFKICGMKVFAASLDKESVSAAGEEFIGALAGFPVAVVIGNEGSGLSKDITASCTGSVKIPMKGPADSLNAAVAAGILIWEMTKSRG